MRWRPCGRTLGCQVHINVSERRSLEDRRIFMDSGCSDHKQAPWEEGKRREAAGKGRVFSGCGRCVWSWETGTIPRRRTVIPCVWLVRGSEPRDSNLVYECYRAGPKEGGLLWSLCPHGWIQQFASVFRCIPHKSDDKVNVGRVWDGLGWLNQTGGYF